ncbi:prosaposin-like isoform X2 [Petaurus breviceps papuanus]|uniref:prosaposin-like isoform X2 n=1 Tax=Petaurus breviceps papuanus TaxID=3040969 RepID=UPI0036DC7889
MNLLLGYWRLLLLALCLPFFPAHASPVLMKEDCAKGSEVWCQNFKTAYECGAVEHCQQTLWSKAPVKNLVQKKVGPTCELCQYVIKEIIRLLESNQSKEVVMKAAEDMCSGIPSYLSGSCRDLVDTFGLSIPHLVLEEIDPDSVCSTLNICQSKRSAHAGNMARVKSGVFCEVCKKVDGYLDRNLEKNSTKAMILAAFEKSCSMLPSTYKDECDEFVRRYEPILIAALHDEMNPDSLCPKIGACPKAPTKPLLGTERCAWGPSYWCKNMETATQCNAVEHCKEHEWN